MITPTPSSPHGPLEPVTAAGRTAIDALLADPISAGCFFDYDGVLAPIVADPGRAHPHPDATATLRRLAAHAGGLGIITGRPVDAVRQLAGWDRPDALTGLGGLHIAGHYGLERFDAGSNQVTAPPEHPGVAAVRTQLPTLLDHLGAPEGTSVEDKTRSLAVHVRRTPDPDAATELLLPSLRALAERNGLAIEPGRMVVELRPPDTHKGVALRDLATGWGSRVLLYAGDDLGDLPAYDAVEEFRTEGVPGLLICSGSTEVDALAARADLVVDGPDGVIGVLQALATAWERG